MHWAKSIPSAGARSSVALYHAGMSTELEFLRERLEAAIGARRDVTRKRMFGCDAYFRDGKMFALVWKEARIGVKLLDDASYAALAKIKGAEAWSPGGKMTMGAWMLVPSAWNEDEDKLRPWVERAHAQAGTAAAPKKKISAPKARARR